MGELKRRQGALRTLQGTHSSGTTRRGTAHFRVWYQGGSRCDLVGFWKKGQVADLRQGKEGELREEFIRGTEVGHRGRVNCGRTCR